MIPRATTLSCPPPMKLPVEESDLIFCDVQAIVRYLKPRNPGTALRFIQAFKTTVERLSEMPYLGRTRSDLGTPEVRSWRVGDFRPYLLFYEVQPDRLR